MGSNGLHGPSDFSGKLRCRAGASYADYITSLGEGGAPRLATGKAGPSRELVTNPQRADPRSGQD